MDGVRGSAAHARATVEEALHEVRPWVALATRLGHVAKGLVYVLVGVFAAEAAIAGGGAVRGPRGSLGIVGHAPWGPGALALLAMGLLYYALWELFRAVRDPEYEARAGWAVFKRVGWFVTATFYLSLGVAALGMLLGTATVSDDEAARGWGQTVASTLPYGHWVLGGVGAIVVITGAGLLRKAWTDHLDPRLDLSGFGRTSASWVSALYRLGTAARGAVLAVIGSFLVRAAVHHHPREAVSLRGALLAVKHQPYGDWLLVGVAIGFVSYGAYELLVAWRRRFRIA
jgi:hypothetical protein